MTPKQFEEWLEDHSFTGDCEEELAVEVSDVRALYDAMMPRWVPVSERLPSWSSFLGRWRNDYQ